MVLPECSCAEKYPALKKYLHQLVARYSPSDSVRCRIVEMTIMRAADQPEILFALPVEKALFFLLNDVAQCELGLVADTEEEDLAFPRPMVQI